MGLGAEVKDSHNGRGACRCPGTGTQERDKGRAHRQQGIASLVVAALRREWHQRREGQVKCFNCGWKRHISTRCPRNAMFCGVGPGLGHSWIVVTNHDGRNCWESVEQLAVVWQKEDKLRIPLQCRQTVLKLAHSIPLAGHMGRDKATQSTVSQQFYWPTIYW